MRFPKSAMLGSTGAVIGAVARGLAQPSADAAPAIDSYNPSATPSTPHGCRPAIAPPAPEAAASLKAPPVGRYVTPYGRAKWAFDALRGKRDRNEITSVLNEVAGAEIPLITRVVGASLYSSPDAINPLLQALCERQKNILALVLTSPQIDLIVDDLFENADTPPGFYIEAIVQLLLAAGAHADLPYEGETPALLVAQKYLEPLEAVAAVLRLADAGANLTQRNNRGQTPLHLLAASPRDELRTRDFTKALTNLVARCDLTCRDDAGNAVADTARAARNFAFLRVVDPPPVRGTRAELEAWCGGPVEAMSTDHVGRLPAEVVARLLLDAREDPVAMAKCMKSMCCAGAWTLDGYSATWPTTFVKLRGISVERGVPVAVETSLAKGLRDAVAAPIATRAINISQWFSDRADDGWRLARAQGRTLVWTKGDQTLALKVEKRGEDRDCVLREAKTIGFLQAACQQTGPQRLTLAGELPQVDDMGTVRRSDLLMALKDSGLSRADQLAFATLVANAGELTVMAYRASPGYFTYLYDLPVAELGRAAERVLEDLYTLAAHGIYFTSIAALFHNQQQLRPDGGRYRALQGVSGRLEAWPAGVAYTDMRASGLADLGDFVLAQDLVDPRGAFCKAFFPDADAAEIVDNVRAEYLLVAELALARQASARDEASAGDPAKRADLWSKVEAAARSLYAVPLVQSGMTRDGAHQFLESAVDWRRYAHQMRFWTTPEYIPFVRQKKLPEGLYEAGCVRNYSLDIHAELCDPSFGFNHRFAELGHQGADLGGFGGINPLLESSRLRHLVAMVGLVKGLPETT